MACLTKDNNNVASSLKTFIEVKCLTTKIHKHKDWEGEDGRILW
jgi:hypothetical protein